MRKAFEPAFSGRHATIATAIVGALLSVHVARLYVLQVVRGEEYVQKGESNFIQERRIPHARGIIYDQRGRVLVDSRPSHDVYMTVAFLPDSTRTLTRLFAPLGLQKSELSEMDARVLSAIEEAHGVVVARDDVPVEACEEMQAIALRDGMRGVAFEESAPDRCRVLVEARELPSRASVFRRLRELVGLSAELMKERVDRALEKSRGLGKFKPTLLLEDIGFDAYARIEAAASLGDLPGIDVVDSQKRRYRHGNLAAHVLGYMNEIGAKELEARKEQGYLLGDMIGRRGIEATHEAELRGKDGVDPVVVDAKGRDMGDERAEALLGPDRRTAPQAGLSLVLSIDEDMQRVAEQMYNGLAGSVVAMEVNTGFILAMASFPTYDPNQVTGPWSKPYLQQITKDPLRPWGNKAIQEHYAPGSTFKAITAAAGLRAKLIDEKSNRACPGFFRLGRSVWRCFNRGGHGHLALVRALQVSCDSYFYSLGYDLGPDRLAETARLFGFGARTGLDLDKETPGIMPDRDYYVRRFGAYTPGLVVNNSIGQGDVTVTPLQLAVAYAAIANGGTVYKPQLVRETRDAEGNTVAIHDPVAVAELGLDKNVLDLMKEALAHVTDPGGTASGLMWRRDRFADVSKWLRESGVTIVGKTGTAQVVRLSKSVQHVDAKDVPYEQRDHAWFVGFAPYDKPEIVVVTMTEHGGFGGSTSGPVTAAVMNRWFTSVRGEGRYEHLPELPPPKRILQAPAKKEEPAANEEQAPATAQSPETDESAPPDTAPVMPSTPPKPDPQAPAPAPTAPDPTP
ncbi:MAG: penicillin-binding protein 2 [Deltaproteobacteria bacterium]|nr:penicillin-binding protein 2 [Deltaproteobacteria bacterium]